MDGSKHSEEPLNQSELYIKLFWTNVNKLMFDEKKEIVSLLSNWQKQTQEIAGKPLELEKLQHKYEIWLSANV